MELISWVYLIVLCFLGFLFLIIPFLLNIKKIEIKFFGIFFLFLSATFISLGLLEPLLFIVDKNSTPNSISAPEILVSHKSHSHNLIKNSILYVLPPDFVPPNYGKFRTFGHSFKSNHLGFREKRFPHKKTKILFGF
jgi:hypothetical protein